MPIVVLLERRQQRARRGVPEPRRPVLANRHDARAVTQDAQLVM